MNVRGCVANQGRVDGVCEIAGIEEHQDTSLCVKIMRIIQSKASSVLGQCSQHDDVRRDKRHTEVPSCTPGVYNFVEIKATHDDHGTIEIDEHQVLGGSLGILTTIKHLDDTSKERRSQQDDT